MSERNNEAEKLAQAVASGSIIQQATERLIYQIVEVCAGHEKEAVEAMRAKCEAIARDYADFGSWEERDGLVAAIATLKDKP